MMASYQNFYAPIRNPGRPSGKVDADLCAQRRTRLITEPSVMLWAFDGVIHHQSNGQMNLSVGAKSFCGKGSAIDYPVHREGAPALIKPHHTFCIDILSVTGVRPDGVRHGDSPSDSVASFRAGICERNSQARVPVEALRG